MGTYNPNHQSTSNLLRGLRGLINTDMIGDVRTLNLQEGLRTYKGMGTCPKP